MEVYIEYVILDNLIMDFLLLKETAKLLKLKYKNLQIFIGAIIGTVGAIVFPLLKILPLYVFLLKILLGLLITFVAIKHNRVFDYIKYFNVFLSRFSDPYYNHYKDLTFEDHRNSFHHITEEMKEYAKSNDIKLLFAGNTQLDANVIIVFPQLMIL